MISPGNILDGYTLLHIIGRGGFGEVWLCRSEAMGDFRALKFIPSAAGTGALEKEYAALLRYRKAAAQLRTPSLMPVEHVNRTAGGLYYIMPLADSTGADSPESPDWKPVTLAAKVAERRTAPAWFSSNEIVEIFSPVLDALQCLADAGLVHRDVKPENILFFAGRPCLADIGLLGDDSAGITHTPTRAGTPGYAAPTWYLGGHPDMFSAAATLYTLLTGNAPDRMGRAAFQFPPQGEKSLTPPERAKWLHFHAIIRRATEENPMERFRNFEEIKKSFPELSFPKKVNRRKMLALTGAFAGGLICSAIGLKKSFFSAKETPQITPPANAVAEKFAPYKERLNALFFAIYRTQEAELKTCLIASAGNGEKISRLVDELLSGLDTLKSKADVADKELEGRVVEYRNDMFNLLRGECCDIKEIALIKTKDKISELAAKYRSSEMEFPYLLSIASAAINDYSDLLAQSDDDKMFFTPDYISKLKSNNLNRWRCLRRSGKKPSGDPEFCNFADAFLQFQSLYQDEQAYNNSALNNQKKLNDMIEKLSIIRVTPKLEARWKRLRSDFNSICQARQQLATAKTKTELEAIRTEFDRAGEIEVTKVTRQKEIERIDFLLDRKHQYNLSIPEKENRLISTENGDDFDIPRWTKIRYVGRKYPAEINFVIQSDSMQIPERHIIVGSFPDSKKDKLYFAKDIVFNWCFGDTVKITAIYKISDDETKIIHNWNFAGHNALKEISAKIKERGNGYEYSLEQMGFPYPWFEQVETIAIPERPHKVTSDDIDGVKKEFERNFPFPR